MSTMWIRVTVPVAVLLFSMAASSAGADEAKTPVLPMILHFGAAPAPSYEAAFNQRLREDGPSPRPRTVGEVQPDGSVQYGSVNVTVKTPCPEGSPHYEPLPLPGRRARK